MERGVKCVIPLLIEEVLKSGFSVKYVDAFRIALTEEPKLLIKQKYSKDSQLSILLSSSDIEKHSILRLRKSAN